MKITRTAYKNTVNFIKDGKNETQQFLTFKPVTKGEAIAHLAESMDNINWSKFSFSSKAVIVGMEGDKFLKNIEFIKEKNEKAKEVTNK